MKKVLTILTVVAVLFLGIIGALAVLPHSHGNDFDHSQHKNCPVYQLGLHGVSADLVLFQAIAALLLLSYLVGVKETILFDFALRFISSRAPPIVLSL